MARILVVDDEIGIRELLSEILYDEGHTVDIAENAAQARELRLKVRPDLVLLDIWMPDTDGVTLLKEWSSQGLLDMSVVMMSGHATIDTAVEATRIGAVDFLEKPITMQKLLTTVANALERGRVNKAPKQVLERVEIGLTSVSGVGDIAARVAYPDAADQGSEDSPEFIDDLRNLSLEQPLREVRDAFERIYFEYHLNREHGSMTRVADKTGLERTHLYRKLKQLGIELTRRRT